MLYINIHISAHSEAKDWKLKIKNNEMKNDLRGQIQPCMCIRKY